MDTLGLERAYELAHSGGVAIERSGRGLLRLTGEQRVWFLQNTVTAELDGVEDGRWVESFFLDVKGHPVAHFRIGVLAEDVWLDVDPPGTEPLKDWFVRYRFRTKVEIEDVSRTCWTTLGVPSDDGVVRDGPVFEVALGDVHTIDSYSGAAPDLPVAGEDLYELLRIEAGVGRFGVDYGPANLPQEAGLTRIVSVTKGCYVGQEVMARIHFRGHANRSVRRVELSGVEGDPVGRSLERDGRPAGTITSAAVSPAVGAIGIGMVRLEVEPGETLDVSGGGTAVAGPVPEGTKLPT